MTAVRYDATDGSGIGNTTVLKVDEVARVLRCGTNVIYRAIAAGDLPAVRVGRSLRVPRSSLIAFLGQDEEADR